MRGIVALEGTMQVILRSRRMQGILMAVVAGGVLGATPLVTVTARAIVMDLIEDIAPMMAGSAMEHPLRHTLDISLTTSTWSSPSRVGHQS